MDRKGSGSLSSLTGTFTPPMSPRDAPMGTPRGGGKGIQMQIQQLADEQERVQKKTFTNWMNTYLKQKQMKVENLFEDIKDGVYLLSLLEVLSGDKLPMEKGQRLKRVHHVSNISTALKFLETKKIKLVNTNVTDIADGKPSIVLGLIWTIILYFQIEDTFAQATVGEDGQPRELSALEKFRKNAKKALLAWTGNAITQRYGIEIKDFGKSWRDGLAFNAIVHTIRPDLVDFEKVRHQSARVNLEQAFSTAENELGIARLLDPEDVDVEKPDEKSVMTYVAQFLKAYPEAGEDPSLGKKIKNPAEQEQSDYNDLMTWLSTEADEILQIVDQPVTDRQQEYMDYLAFKTELDRRETVFKKLEDKVLTKKAVRITEDMFKNLDTKWKQAARQTRMWLWKLDASLPGRLGKFGDWLNQAEEVLDQDPEALENHEEMANQLAKLVAEQKEFFKELEPYKQFFMGVKKAGRYDGEFLPPPQLENLAQRLQKVSSVVPIREKKFEFDEYRHRILACQEPTEAKLTLWADKLGRQPEVEEMVADYQDFVVNKQLFRHYDQTNEELKKKADAYRKVADKEEQKRIKTFLEGGEDAWRKAANEVKRMQNVLENVLDNWKAYNPLVDELIDWVEQGEQVMTMSTEEKQNFFSELPQFEEKLQKLKDSGNILIDSCQDPIAEEIRNTIDSLSMRFVNLSDGYTTFQQVEVVGKARQEYSVGVGRISDWLQQAEEILAQEVPCVHAALKEYLQDLDILNSQVADMENDFKVTTKTAQSLVKDSEQDIVNEMLHTLNIQKEVIVRIRKEIPEKLKYLKAVLPNVESLETGMSDLTDWLERGEALLTTHKLDGTAQETDTRLEKHKAYFAETTYQKSIMESKNKVHQKVGTTKPKLTNVNFSPVDEPMADLNKRFQDCLNLAKDWEKKLDNLSRLWRNLQQKESAVDAWLNQAQAVINDNEDDPDSLIRKHKKFFGRIDQKLLDDYQKTAQEVLAFLEEKDKSDLKHNMAEVQNRWKQVMSMAPVKLIKLEFCIPEDNFTQSLESAEQTIASEQRQLQAQDNVKDVLRKHRQIFVESQFVPNCTKCLESMQTLAKDLMKLVPRDASLQNRYEEHLERWKRLQITLDTVHLGLKQLPERWKEYNDKLGDFNNAVLSVEDLIKELQRENLTSDEYKDLQNKFQRALRNMRKFEDDANGLQENLDELLKDSPDADAAAERRRLKELLAKFQGLQPKLEPVSDKSAVFSKAYDFRDGIDKRANWLDETQKLVMDQPFIDGLDDARAYLREHEGIMTKLESEGPNIQADIAAGKRLQKERNAPTFVAKSVEDLDRKWKDTNELAQAKHAKLKQKVKDWEQYEGDKGQLLQYLKKAEAELEKPPLTNGQEVAQKDLSSKKELKNTLSRLKGTISDMQKLNAALCEGASRERQGPLKGELTDIDKRLENVSVRLNAKLADLEATIAKWTEYYKRLNHFCDWLNEKETKLNEVYENKTAAPEDQLTKSKAIASEVYENHISLETLEKDARGLSQNFRSRETAALKTKLASIRRQWESLCSRAKDRSSALTGSVAHWQTHQNLSQQLMPWIVKAEKYCATELPKCSSLEEAKDLYDLHQSFLRECEENFPIFEKMNTEAGYLMEQPNMARDMEALQKRWNNIIGNSEERSHKVDKMNGAWTAYDQELSNFDEVLEKFQNRLAQEPNVNSTDVQVLEHELALCKTLQDEIRAQQPHLNALQRQFEQVKQHATPDGVQSLKSKHDAVKGAFNKIAEDAAERQAMLNAAVRHRQDFYGQLQDFEKWMKKSQRKLDSGNEIYSDEVAEMQAKLKALKGECEAHDPVFNHLSQEFKDLIQNCDEEEAAILRDRFDHLMAGYTKIEDLIKNREDLCENWAKYSGDHKETQARLKTLQAKLASPDIKEEEVAKINKEVESLRRSMAPWQRQAEQLDDLMANAQLVIKDRATQRTLHFGTEVQAIENLCDSVTNNARMKEDHLGELSNLWQDFGDKKETFVEKLHALAHKIEEAKVGNSSIQGIKDLVREIEDARDDLFACNPEYEQLRELGRQIMQADVSKGGAVQGQLSEVNEAWDQVQALLAAKHQTYSGVANMWQQYNDTKQGVVRVLEDVEPVTAQEITFATQPEVKKALDQHKNAEFELHANQSQLDQMNNRGLQLLDELRNLPNFDVAVLEQDLDQVNHAWETASSDVEAHKENLEAQLVCWDQVQTGKEEVESWVNAMTTKLDDSLQHFDDAVSVESCLMKYKEEAPYFQEVLSELQQKVQDLAELNKDNDIPGLQQQQEEIQEQMERATAMANKLESIMENFSDERTNLQRAIEKETEWLNKIKDKLAKCDDVSGTDEDLVQRLQTTRDLEAELEAHKKNIKALQDKSNELKSKYPSAETNNLAKDADVLAKKFDAVTNRGDKIEDMLESSLEQHCQDAQLQQQRWLNAAKEKVAWCGDIAGDRYSVEAKLATIKDLMDSVKEGEQKKNLAKAKVDTAKSVLPKQRQAELDKQKTAAEKEWDDLVEQIQNTQAKLEGSINQWTEYDGQYEALSQWLKSMEAKVRNDSSLKPDLPNKVEQFEEFTNMEQQVQSHRLQFEELKNAAQEISRSTGDARTASYAGQLHSRYQTLTAAVKEQVEKCEENVDDHENYLKRHKACTEWLESAQQQLEDCGDLSNDQESLQAKIETVEDLMSSKEQGLSKFNAALESGEKLYPNTSNDGREGIRRELRSLREMWESFNDSLNDTQRQLESSRMQWSTFDDNFDQLLKWVADMEEQIRSDNELRNSLQEKKAMLQHYRTRTQDITSHQTMIDSISDKGAALSSQGVKGKLNELNNKYRTLCGNAQSQAKSAEEQVDQHQLLQDNIQQCRDWMAMTKDKLAVCSEVTGDKQALQNRLDRVQDLLASLKDGEKKVKNTHTQGEKTIPQTAKPGQATIRSELEGLTVDWEALANKLGDTQQNITHAIQALQAYDGSCESLNRWLRETEAQIKDHDLKSTLKEKQIHVEKFKALQEEVKAKQPQFDDLANMASQVQGSDTRLVNLSSQLGTRYQAAKTNLRDALSRLKEHVREHEAYQENFSECSEWVNTLHKRLQVCADLAGDKHDVEDRLIKLQELLAEKEQGTAKIHYTVESGEKLYPSTASEGRDIIRQELRGLRDTWEQVCDTLSDTQRKLDTCLLQWSSYDENFEQFQKWLLDTEMQLREDTDQKATLPDKKAQLQNHRVLHQDIMSRQHVMDNLSEKAKNLSQASPSAKANKFVGELHNKYDSLCGNSKQTMEKLETAAKDHQLYQDMYQDCQDWLNASRDKVEACSDTSGDKMSLQHKLERLKEFADKVEDGEKKLKATKELCDKTARNTNQPGRDVLRREIDHLQSDWEDYLARIQQAEEDLENALVQWGDFETKFADCSAWLKEIEQQVKNYELKSTLQEKQAQVDKFKKQREEILSHQPEIDRFTDDAQNLMHTSSDARLSTQVSQLTNRYRGLLSLVKDLISKWEKYVQDHQSYHNRHKDFTAWLSTATEKLDACQEAAADQEAMEERRVMIQMLLSEKDHGLQRLNGTVEAGERLYPDTAAGGREKVRQELRQCKDEWDRLFNGLSDTQRRVESYLMQWSSYSDGQDQLMRWMAETEEALRSDQDMKNTLQEKRLQLQNNRSMLQDILSHQRLVDSVIEKAQSVLQNTSNPEVATFIKDVNSKYERLAANAKGAIQQSDHNVQDHSQYQESLQVAVDWLTLMKDRASMCSDTSGDRHTLQNKLDRVQELLVAIPDGTVKVDSCEEKAETTMETTALKGRQGIQQELDVLKMDWESHMTHIRSLKDNLERAVKHWGKYEEQYDSISVWVKDMEKKIKDFPHKSTQEEKQQQLQNCQELARDINDRKPDLEEFVLLESTLMQEIKAHQRQMDQFSDEAQTLQQLTGETRVGTSISQLTSRYQTLQHSIKDILKKCEGNVSDHHFYKEKQADCSQWLAKAKEKFAQGADSTGSRSELEDRLEKVQELTNDRDAGFSKLNTVVEAGEKLYPNTASEGREVVRQELRHLKLGWESLYDDLSATQRKLEVALVQWTSFDDSYGQVEHWLREMEVQLEGQFPLRSTLEEKKTQLQNYKVLHQDVLSYQRVMDSVNDKAQSLVQSSSDPQLSKFVTGARTRYQKLCSSAKERVSQYEKFVAEHQQYNDAYNNCIEWLNGIREKLSMCSDVSGDRHTIQSRLDKIQRRCDIVATKMEGEPKVKNVVSLAEKILPNTAPQGKEIIMRETDALKDDWEAFVNALQKTKADLENCMDQWKEFDTWQEKVSAWLKEMEVKVRDTELKATLKDKQGQLDKLKRLQKELLEHQGDIDALSDSAQDLVRVSTDTRVISQASQLGTKYQTVCVNVKELCRRWEQYVLDHQAYQSSFDQCKSWLNDMRKKLQAHSDTSGDRQIIQGRLGDVHELITDKEEGLHLLQIALDNLQIVLPNTSVPGRDNMRREMQGLQAEYDALSGDLNELKTKLDGTLAQWTVYDDSIEQLNRWLQELEKQLESESQQQNTLQEKKLQLDRVKVLQLNIASQQSTIDNLNDKAENLKQTSKEANLGNQIRKLVSRYERLLGRVKDLLVKCEKNVKDHQTYRDSFMDSSDWLSEAVDRLNMCSDVRGDRTTVEAQLHKLQEVFSTNPAGRDKLQATIGKGDIVLPETSSQGQELIKEELGMLAKEFDNFSTECDELNSNLERLLEEWRMYEEQYDDLSQWIKDTEVDMKSESELKATLEDKTIQLEKQHGCHEEVLSKQATFDALAERAQTLLQSTTDNRVTSQLTQMSARYTSLITSSKELLKRYEQHTQDHEQYADAFTEAATWLQSTRDKLSVCADTSGDRFMIQNQLEKLQEFVVVKEEGQLLIHTANTWGEKAMTNTSLEGREMIRKELQQLQQEWDNMMSEFTDTKVMLESYLLQWTDYSDSYDKINKRLRDMEKRLRETDPKADLSEKKADLQRLKGLYQDVISYEQMIESIGEKAQDLASKSPAASTDTTAVVNKYQAVKDQAQDLLAKSEQCVAQHQAYHDACNSFITWLRTSREKLATCSDTFGEKATIITKIERAKALTSDMTEGAQRLTEATKAGEGTLSSTSASGQTKIRQELQSMKRDFDEYRTLLLEAQEDLERCLSRWNDFEESYTQFNTWLKETETYLRSDPEMKGSVDEKKRHWELYQNYLEDVLGQQSSLDKVNEKAQALLQTNADAKTSHAITQLTTRYQGVIALSKDIVKNLEGHYGNHMNYKTNYDDFQDWLAETQQKLRNIHDSAGNKDDVSNKLDKSMEIQAAMDLGHNYLRALLESSERTIPNTNPRGTQLIKQETDGAKQDYENLLTDVSQAKRNLESALSQWGEFDRLHDQFNAWLVEIENKLKTDPEFRADLPEKRSNLERIRALQADIAGHRDALDRIEDRAGQLRDSRPQAMANQLRTRYHRMTNASKDATLKLEDQVLSHEEYRKAYIACLDWLANNRHRLQRLSDYSGDRRTLQDRLQQLKDFKGEMRQGQDMVNNATQLGERVCLTTAPRGQDAIHREIANLKEDWNAFASSINEMEANLDSCIGNWLEMDEEFHRFQQWTEKMESRVKGLQENLPDQQRKQQKLMEAEDMFDEIMKHKASLENVKDRSEAVSQRSSDPRVSNDMMHLSAKYQSLTSAAKSMVQKLGENAKDHKMYNEAFDIAADWLAEMEERVQSCNDTSGDWHTVQDRVEDVKDITASMDEGLKKVNLVCDLAEKILPHTSSEGKRIIEQQVTELTNEWEKLNLGISECSNMLEGVQDRWNDYEEYYGSLVKWLADMEHQLRMDPEPKAQLVEKKTQLDKYKLVLSDVENHHRLVNELAERVANLEALSESPEVSDSLADVQNRYDKVRGRARDVVAALERAYHDHLDFHEAQQDSEKWLLQTSFKLMSHNSLNVSSMELTQRQIDKHRSMIQDIEDYRTTLDRVNMKGRHLVDENVRVPKMAQNVQSQLQNLEESYLNLQTTAEQIRNRLNDVLQKWQQYKDLLEKDQQFLNQEFPMWLEETDRNVPDNLQKAQNKLENTRAMWERLNAMRQELTTASHRCENLGSMENLDQSEQEVASPLMQLADDVNGQVKDAISQVERRMDGVRDTIHQWESVDRQRGDLRNWLHNKHEELLDLEQRPSKLHAEAAELEIANLQALREEVQAKGPAIDGFLNRYRELTEHNPALVDPVMKAVREDWEELLGQIENLLEVKEQALQASRELQERTTDMDNELANFVEELEKIEASEATVADKAHQLKRKKCRGTQTPNASARFSGRSRTLGSDDSDDDDDDGDDSVFRWPSTGHGPRSSGSKRSLKHRPSSHSHGPHSARRPPSSRNDDLKKGAAAAAAGDSESEESGYGETYYTMHASSFDNTADLFGSVTLDTMRGTPLGLEANNFSDADSTVSYITGDFPAINPDDLHDATSQTPGHATTQTPGDMWKGSSRNISTQMPHSMQTQTGRASALRNSTMSLQSVGAQTRRSLSGSRTDLLKSILSDVKTLKSQRGLDTPSEDTRSLSSSMDRDMLNTLSSDIRTLKDAGSHGNAGTQTLSEQGTQTGNRIFPEGDPVRSSRHGRLNDLMDEVRTLKNGERAPSVVSSEMQSRLSSRAGTPHERRSMVSGNRHSPVRFATPRPLVNPAPPVQMPQLNGYPQQNGFDPYQTGPGYYQMPQNTALNANAPATMGGVPPPMMNGQAQLPPGIRRVTADDLNAVSERIDRLRNYQIPPRRLPPPPPPPPPQYVVPVFSAPPRRQVRIREFPQSYDDGLDGYRSDESEYEGGRGPRRGRSQRGVMDRYGLDDAFDEANKAANQLKHMSKKLRDSLRDELLRG